MAEQILQTMEQQGFACTLSYSTFLSIVANHAAAAAAAATTSSTVGGPGDQQPPKRSNYSNNNSNRKTGNIIQNNVIGQSRQIKY